MYTKKEIKSLESALRKVKKCDGDCRHCKKCHVYTASTEKSLYFAVGCDLLPVDLFSCIADTPGKLKAAAIETLEFELS